MKTETPRTTALIADIVQNPGLEWTCAEVEQLGEHAFQLECELNEAKMLILKTINDDLSTQDMQRMEQIAAVMPNIKADASRTCDEK